MPHFNSRGGSSVRGSPYETKAKNALFLVSKHSHQILGKDAEIDELIEKLNRTEGVGIGADKRLIEDGFKEGAPLGKQAPGFSGIVTDEQLSLHHDPNGNWASTFEQYAAMTTFGVLVLAETQQDFQAWFAHPATHLELNATQAGRTFVLFDGKLLPLTDDGSATLSEGEGTILYSNGAVYNGGVKGGYKHGVGKTISLSSAGGTIAEYDNGDMVKLIREDSGMSERGLGDAYDAKWLGNANEGSSPGGGSPGRRSSKTPQDMVYSAISPSTPSTFHSSSPESTQQTELDAPPS